jgi:hypothetical protein
MQRLRSLFAPVAVIGMAHVAGGVAALFAPGAAHVSGLAGLTMLGLWPGFTAFLLIIVGLMAICSRMRRGLAIAGASDGPSFRNGNNMLILFGHSVSLSLFY